MGVYAISEGTKEKVNIYSNDDIQALLPKIHTVTVTAANGEITVPANGAILSVQNCDAANSNDAVTSWARLSHNKLYYNKSGSSPTTIQIVYYGFMTGGSSVG